MAVRDRVVLWSLSGGALAALIAWRLVGPWPAMVVGVLGVLIACAAYRIEAPRIDLDHLPLEEPAGRMSAPAAPAEKIDQ